MPLVRYEIRSEYELANRELYRSAPKNDPEAILEGVAMVSLVGIVRQLGDLAEFAADIFHDLYEAVMATASRSHDLVLRVTQLEAELSSVEKNFFSKKTNPLQFAYSPGVEFHANIQIDQNHCTQGDLPRFIRSSYEECRGPPKLFLLDKFDIGGVGACLKRYTDPSFFKMEWASAELMKAEKAQQDKKARKAKKARRRKDTEPKDVRPTIHLQPRMRYSTISTSSVDALSESTTPLGTMMVDNDETNKPYPFTTFLGGSQHGSRDGKSPLKSVRKSELDKDVAHVKTAPPEIEEVTEMGPQEDAAKENEIMMIQSNEVHEDVLSEPEQFMDARATIDSESDSEPRWRRRWADTKPAIPTASRSDKELKVQEPEDDTDAFFEDARNSNMDSETEAESKYSVDLTPIPIPVQHGDIQHDSIELARHDGYDEQESSVPQELKHEDSTDMKDKEIAGELRKEHVVSHEDMNGQASKVSQPEDDVRVDRTDRQSNDFEQNIQHTTIGEDILEKEVNNELHEHGREGILHPVQRQEKSETKMKANSDVDEDEPFDVEVIQVIGDEPKEVEFEQVAMSEDEPEPLDKEVEQDQVVVEKEPATETLSSVYETESEEVKEPLTTFKVKDSGTLQETQEYDRFTAEELKEPVVQEERQELESEESKELVQESDVHNLVEDELKDSRGSAALPKTPTSSEAEVEDREVEREDDFESASSQDDFFQSSSRFSDAGYSDAISFANDQMGVADDEDGYSGDDESTKNDHSGEASELHSPVAGEGQEDPHVSHEHVSHVEPVVLQNVLLQSKEELLDESVRLQPENEEIFEQNVGMQPHKELEVQDEDDKHYKLEDLEADEQDGEQEHQLSRSYEDLATQPSSSYEDVSRLEVNKEQQVQQYFEQKVEDKVQGEELKDEGSESHVREHPDGHNIQYTLDEQNQESIPPLVDDEIAEKQVDTESRSIDLHIVPEPSSVPLSITIPETSDEDLLYSELEKSDSTESSPRSPVFSAIQAPMSPVQSPDTTADFTTMLAPSSPTALDELTPTAGAMPMTLDELPPAASSLPTLDELPPLPPLPPLRWRTSHSPRQPFAFRIPGLSSEVPHQSVLSDARPVIADKQVHPEVAATHSVALPEVYVQSSPVSDKPAELESAPEVLPPRMREQQVHPEVAATHSVALPEVSVQSSPVSDKQAELESAPEVLPPRMRVHPEVAATQSVTLPEVFVQSSPVSDKQAELESAPEVLPPRMREQSHPESAQDPEPVPEVSQVVPRIGEQEPQQHPESVLEASEAPVDKQAHLEPVIEVLQAPEPVTEVLEAPESHPEPVTDVFEAPEAHPEPIPEVSEVPHEPEPVQHPEAVLEVLEAPGDKQVHPEPVTEVPEAHTELVTQMPEVAESHPEPVTEMPEVLEAHSEPAPEDESEPTTEISAHPDDKQAHAPATEAASGSLEPGNTQPEESLPPLSDKQVQEHAEPAHSQVQAHAEPGPSPSENSSSLTRRLRSLFFGDKEVHSEPAAGVSEKPLESLQVGDRPKAADQGALEGSARSSHEPSQPVDEDHAHPEPAVSESLHVDEGPETVVSHPEVPLQRVSVSDKPEASSSESSLTGRLKSYLFGDKKANSDSASRGGDDLQATVHQPESVQPGDVKVSEGSTLSLETPEILQAQSEVVEQRSPEPAVHQAELSEEESPSKQTLEVLQPELEVVEQSSPPEDVADQVLEQSTQAEDGIETYEKIVPVTQAHAEPVLETLHIPSDAEEDIQWPGLAQLTAERSPPADDRSVHPEPEGVGELGYHEHHNSALEVLEVSSVPESWLLDDFQSPEPPAQPTSRRRKWTDSEIFEASLRVLEHESGEEAEEDLPVSSAPETYLELEQPTQPQASQGLPFEEDQGVCSTLKDLPVDEFEHLRQPRVLQTPGVHLHKPPETLRDNNEQTSPEIPSPPAENGQRHSGTTSVPFLPTIPLFAKKDGSLLQAITEHDKSKMKRVPSDLRPKALDERGDLLEQIRAQSFNLRHTVVEKKQHKEAATPPRLVNNINVAAILEKANAIRQAFAGSDDDQDDDWSD